MQPQDPPANAALLRRATPTDAAAVRKVTRAAYAKWVPVIGREPRPMTADYDAAVRDHLVDLLQVAGELVALIEMRPERDHLLIVNVAVAPALQGRGHGRALLAHAEAVARSLGLAELRLYTNGRFTENLRLYGRLGYRVDREELHPQFGAVVHMRKRLPAPGSGAILVRPLGAADHEAWLPLWKGYQAFYKAAIADDVTHTAWLRLLDPAEPMHAALALDDSGNAVGLVHWLTHRSTWANGDYCYLQDLYVAPEMRGRGAGRRLIEHVYREAAALGCSRVYWLTHETNRDAMTLYDRVAERTGFVQYRKALR